jgi:hypothetical protein
MVDIEDTSQLFAALVPARGEQRNHLYQKLLHLGEPEILLHTALEAYRTHGNEERLAVAASLLADMGTRSFPALQSLVQSGSPECGMFIPVIAHCREIEMTRRLELLMILTSNPDVYVRISLLTETQHLRPEDAKPILQRLSNDTDAEIEEDARTYLEALDSPVDRGE